MTDEPQKFSFSFNYVMPVDHLMTAAQESIESPDEDVRAVGKALIDVTTEASKIRQGFADDGNVDLAPFFDFWFADALEAANRLLDSPDDNIRQLAECLINQEQAVMESKEGFLAETKRLGIKPKS